MQQWHQMPMQAVLEALHTSSDGLSAAESSHRLAAYGANVLVARKRRTALGMILSQFTDFMVLVLIVAAAISGLIGELQDTLAVVAIVVLNAVVGFVQEYRADRAMEALRAMAAHTATIVREGQMAAVPAAEIVPGDLVVLEAGGIVPADLRLLETARLRVNEASLTGESVPVDKRTEPLEGETLSLGDRTNMAFKGTAVTYGRGRGVVVATGMATEFGKIAGMLQEVGEGATPLQRRLSRFGRALALGALAICALVFAAGILRGEPPLLMFLTAVSLAVAAIPEALPAVVTTTLALGARHMARQQALMRRLSAVETLGSVTYICTDKTGTLTANRMRVEAFYCDGALAHAPGSGSAWEALLRAMALCSDAGPDASGTTIGDPTEVALMVAARDVGVEKHALEQRYPRVAELPFDAHRKCMTTLHRDPAGGFLAVSKGAVEVLLGKSVRMLQEDGPIELHPDQLTRVSESMAAGGLRVLAFGIRRMPVLPAMLCPESVECDLTLLGVVGLVDPPRPEAREAVAQCKSAGIVPIMITGDHSITAQAIARQLGILDSSDEIMTGEELAALSPDDLGTRVEGIRVYARVAPEQKLRIVRALQGRGEIVAMTGDGVNDAPALKQADIGVAMGMTGADVAREASAMILLDDNFATIIRAIREGRRIYDNIRRFIRYAVTTNSGEILTMFLAPLLGLPLPLLPIQILWINLVTDGLPGLALAAEPAERNVMRRPPRPPQEGIFAHGMGSHMIWVGLLMAALTLGTQAWFFHVGSGRWQTIVFTVLCLSQLAHVLAIRSERASLFTQGLLSNLPLLGAVVLTVLLQLATIYVPVLNGVFKTEPLHPTELAMTFGVAAVVFFAVEGEKWLKRYP